MECAMAAALAEASNESCHGMQMTKEKAKVEVTTTNTETATVPVVEKSNVASKSSQNATATVEATSITETRTTSSMASAISATALANRSQSDDDNDDATMHTPSASPATSFEASEEFMGSMAEGVTTGSDFGSGISITTTTTTGTGSNPNSSYNTPASISIGGHSDQDNIADMPQWKKELIQRRKANIARTIGANQPGLGTMKGTTTTATNTAGTMAAGTITPTSPVLTIAKNFCNDSSTFVLGSVANAGSGSSKSGSHSIGVNNGVNARTPDIIQHDASSEGHYTAHSCQQSQLHPQQQQLPCVDNNHSSQAAASSPMFAKPKTSASSLAGSCGAWAGTGTGTGASTGNDGLRSPGSQSSSSNSIKTNGTKCTSDGSATLATATSTATTTRGAGKGTCSTTSPPSESARLLPFSNRLSQQLQQQQQQVDSVVLQASSSVPSQLHSRLDVERSGDSSSSSQSLLSLSSSQSQSESCNSVATGSSSFVKNPFVSKSTSKFTKLKSSSAKPSVAESANVNASSVTPNAISNISANSGGIVASGTSASNSGSSSNSRKMVAAQELSDANDTFDDFDPTEELQYGPGIVSKLRCRYLSLALRQSAGKQRPALDNLRRATSLNNLLDDDDRGSNSSCTTNTEHSVSAGHDTTRPSSENMGKSPDEFVATFQKNLKVSDKQRSRHVKRGNDSLKRARSVEALLVYGDKAWDNEGGTVLANGVPVQMRYSYMQRLEAAKPDISSITSAAEVTIEEKILSARERSSLIEKPPRKISPFMDETERPPPDVVKQTLKIFEATANRRGRGLGRGNCNGEVATKVRNYKSIIAQEKPPIIFPKPPLSPKKHIRKPGTPPGGLDIVAAKKIVNNQQQSAGKKSNQASSPISNLTKKFAPNATAEIANIDPIMNVESHSPTTLTAMSAELKTSPTPVPSARTLVPFRINAKNESTPIRSSPFSDGAHSPSTPDIIPRKVFDSGPNFAAAVSSADSPVSQLTKHIERLKIESPTPPSLVLQPSTGSTSPALGALSPIGKLQPRPKRSSDTEEDDDDDLDGESLTKRISKSALDNISKAGTTQQFNFSNANKSPNISTKSPLLTASVATAVNGNSTATAGAGSSQLTAATIAATVNAKQIGVIRPLVAESKLQQQQQTESTNKLKPCTPNNATPVVSDYTSSADELVVTTKARDNLVISNLSQQQQQLLASANSVVNNVNSSKSNNSYNSSNSTKSIIDEPLLVVQPPTLTPPTPPQRPTLTSREIEKNLINTKKNEEANLLEAAAAAAAAVVTNNGDNNGVGGGKWQFAKKKARSTGATQQQQQATQNTMIFNFKDRKEVPDYIENDGLLFRRKRELPKPNESGFVLLGDLSLETSTDPDDEWTLGPPSPCDVEFENANIIIDGKSSIRSKSKDISLRVQFDDTLTSTFEYPSESSFVDETTTATTLKAIDNIDTDNIGHIVTANANSTTAKNITTVSTEEIIKNPGQKLLGSMSLGSAPLGSYIPMKAQINTHFELGVTRNPDTSESSDDFRQHANNTNNIASLKKSTTSTTPTTNGNSSDSEIMKSNGKTNSSTCNTNGVDYILNGGSECNNDEPESLQYLKPATDDLTVAYSEGTQKTDLLY